MSAPTVTLGDVTYTVSARLSAANYPREGTTVHGLAFDVTSSDGRPLGYLEGFWYGEGVILGGLAGRRRSRVEVVTLATACEDPVERIVRAHDAASNKRTGTYSLQRL